jgi:hypothetical protein
METLLTVLLPIAVLALAYLAYKRPRLYEPVSYVVVGIIMTALAAALIWDLAIGRAYNVVLPYVGAAQEQSVRQAMEAEIVLDMSVILSAVLLMIYVIALMWLPAFLGKPKGED